MLSNNFSWNQRSNWFFVHFWLISLYSELLAEWNLFILLFMLQWSSRKELRTLSRMLDWRLYISLHLRFTKGFLFPNFPLTLLRAGFAKTGLYWVAGFLPTWSLIGGYFCSSTLLSFVWVVSSYSSSSEILSSYSTRAPLLFCGSLLTFLRWNGLVLTFIFKLYFSYFTLFLLLMVHNSRAFVCSKTL